MKRIASPAMILAGALTFFCSSVDQTLALQAKRASEQEWDRTVQAAKREGQVTVLTQYDAFLDFLKKDYPGIKVLGIVGKGTALWPRIMAERRAGKYLADVMVSGSFPPYPDMYKAGVLDPIRPFLLLPEVTDESAWHEGRHRYVDPENKYVFLHTSNPGGGSVGYNSNLANPREFRSYWDLLNPRWKGRIVVFDPLAGRAQMRFFYHSPELGPKFLRQLFGEMDVTITMNKRQPVDWLSIGKFALCFFCQDVDDAKAHGLPVDQFTVHWKEGIDTSAKGYGVLSLINRAPHPKAATVFINWFLSRRGQLAFQKSFASSSAPNSLRDDIPKDYLPISSRRMEGLRYVNTEHPEWLESRQVVVDFVRQVLRETGKL